MVCVRWFVRRNYLLLARTGVEQSSPLSCCSSSQRGLQLQVVPSLRSRGRLAFELITTNYTSHRFTPLAVLNSVLRITEVIVTVTITQFRVIRLL
jgi:hypothetical protein